MHYLARLSREQTVRVCGGREEAFQALLPTLWTGGLNLSDTLNVGWSPPMKAFVALSSDEHELQTYLERLGIAPPLRLAA